MESNKKLSEMQWYPEEINGILCMQVEKAGEQFIYAEEFSKGSSAGVIGNSWNWMQGEATKEWLKGFLESG